MSINNFICSDTHFDHKNIMIYCNRPFSTVEDMNETIIQNWNNKVQPNDHVWHLGDVGCWFNSKQDWIDTIIPRLHGHLHLIPGNHDEKLLTKLAGKFTIERDICQKEFTTEEGRFKFIMCHYPMFSWNSSHYGSIHCYGHTHGCSDTSPCGPNAVDVSVDSNNFTPLSIQDIITIVTKNNMGTLPQKVK